MPVFSISSRALRCSGVRVTVRIGVPYHPFFCLNQKVCLVFAIPQFDAILFA